MNTRQTILDELQAISPPMAGIKNELPFSSPPAGYFEALASQVLLRIRTALPDDKTLTAGIIGSFAAADESETFIRGILSNAPLQDNKTETLRAEQTDALSPLEELNMLSQVLGKIDKQPPFSVPEGYFDSIAPAVAGNIKMSGTISDEPDMESSLLGGIKEKNTYTVPANYFNELPGNIIGKIKRSEEIKSAPAKIIQMPPKRKWMRYAVAAVVAGIMISGGLLFLDNNASNHSGNSKLVVHTNETGSNKSALQDKLPEEMKNLSVAEMDNYLENENIIFPDEVILASSDLNSDDLQEMLADIPDVTLQGYISQTANME